MTIQITHANVSADSIFHYRFVKRMLDIAIAGTLLLLLSPLLAIIAILIKLESKGPVFYSSKRVGEGYRVFDFYKFRSMRTNADALLEKMKDQNQYGSKTEPLQNKNQPCWQKSFDEAFLVCDDGYLSEETWQQLDMAAKANTFVKFKNDSRITKVGKFIRNTSIDELPQLVNVLKGDMSLVGNRPLPLYEAEKLTSDEAIGRFLAPAGITGLWQVTERGKSKADANSRKQLDVQYAEKMSLILDFEILFKTPLAALQHENV